MGITVLVMAGWLGSQANVTTANYDLDRTNANLAEKTLRVENVNARQFGKLRELRVDGQVYAQPLYLSGLDIQGRIRNVLFAVTMHNSVYAFDADNGQPLWKVTLGAVVPAELYRFRDIEPEIGILSTPVIDVNRGVLYCVSNHYENDEVSFRLNALDLRTGEHRLNSPATIQASVSGRSDDALDGVLTFRAFDHLQRPGLVLANGKIYVCFGSHADQGDYHGWIIAYEAADVQKPAGAFATTPNGWGGAIWHSGRAPAVDAEGNLYVVTGNGDFDNDTSLSQSLLRLDSGLNLLSYFTPGNWMETNEIDYDVGSVGPVLLPNFNLVVTGGKSGWVHAAAQDQLGGLDLAGDVTSFNFPAVSFGIFSTALWNRGDDALMYLQAQDDGVKAFRITAGGFDPLPATRDNSRNGIPYQGMALSADGANPATGILWVNSADDVLIAYHAADLSRELWNSYQVPADNLGPFAKFATPTIADGKVFVPTFDNKVAVYGLLPEPRVALALRDRQQLIRERRGRTMRPPPVRY
jgi:outer membrane protein assembly factor BamB